MATIDPNDIDLFIYTDREGVLSPVGHDLKLTFAVRRIDVADGTLEVVVDAKSGRVAGCIVDGKEKSVSLMDRKVIERNMAKDVLAASKHPDIVFRTTDIDSTDGSMRVTGELTLRGVTRPLELVAERDSGGWRAKAELHQPTWELEPYTAFLGALKIKPSVRIEVRIADGSWIEAL